MLTRLTRRMLFGLALVLPVIAGIGGAQSDTKELRVLAWQGYADDDWVKEFEAKTGADVKVVYMGTNDEAWAKIKGSEGKDYDLLSINTAQLKRYIDGGLTTPFDLDKLPNQKEALERFRDLSKVPGLTRDGKVHAVPYAFDSIGLIYNKDKVKTAPTSMDVLWDPQYKGKVLAYDDGEQNFAATALMMGMTKPFNLTAEEMAKVKDKLSELKKNVLSFYTTPDEALQLYKSNDVVLIAASYGQQQVKAMKDAGANIAYINPSEGALAWLDTWMMTSGVQNKDLAEEFVNFLLQKKIGQQLSERTGYGNAVAETASAGPNDKIVWLESVEDPTKRADLWNEIKAAP